jgi:hypothetical protein
MHGIFKSITHHLLRETSDKYCVKLIAGRLDEAPQAHKDREWV